MMDRNSLNMNKLDNNGVDTKGLDANGLDANGLDANGLDANGLDTNGLDTNGLDSDNSSNKLANTKRSSVKPPLLTLLSIVLVITVYFLINTFVEPIHNVSLPIDYSIPYVSWFIVFYVLLYPVLFLASGAMVYLVHKDNKYRYEFYHWLAYFAVCMVISFSILSIYPSYIDFRPTSFADDTFFTRLTLQIYSADRPTTVFPSQHCLFMFSICVAAFRLNSIRAIRFRNHRAKFLIRGITIFLSMMIVLSTLFVRQHSVCDILGAIAVAAIAYPLAYIIPWKKLYASVAKRLNA